MAAQDATWMVYLQEWMTVYTSDAAGMDGEAECREHFGGKYDGRVRPQDCRFTVFLPGAGSRPPELPVCLQLRLWNLRGEFKDRADAMTLVRELGGRHPDSALQMVRRGSPEERALLDYGKKMLPAGGSGGQGF